MQTPGESSHAYHLLLKSDLFRYHSERMINLILAEAEEVSLVPLFLYALLRLAFAYPRSSSPIITRMVIQNTNPHTLYILYNILLLWGAKHHSLFRSHRRWKRLSRGLGDVFEVEVDEVSTVSFSFPCLSQSRGTGNGVCVSGGLANNALGWFCSAHLIRTGMPLSKLG